MPDTPALLRPDAVAHRLGISVTHVSRLADAGKIPFQLTPGGHRRFRAEDIDQIVSDLAEKASR